LFCFGFEKRDEEINSNWTSFTTGTGTGERVYFTTASSPSSGVIELKSENRNKRD
jgi:hypothetical protein